MSTVTVGMKRKTWTRAEMDTLDAAGHLAGCRYELIEGEIFDKMGQNPPYASAITRLANLLGHLFVFARIRSQSPVEAATRERTRSLPEPDVAVARESEVAYRSRHPEAGDVLLLAEVSDTTIALDTGVKAKLCARAGYPEYWVLDLNIQMLVVFRDPVRGAYRLRTIYRPGDSLSPLAAPESSIAVSDLFQ